jgi:hypothetical protein
VDATGGASELPGGCGSGVAGGKATGGVGWNGHARSRGSIGDDANAGRLGRRADRRVGRSRSVGRDGRSRAGRRRGSTADESRGNVSRRRAGDSDRGNAAAAVVGGCGSVAVRSAGRLGSAGGSTGRGRISWCGSIGRLGNINAGLETLVGTCGTGLEDLGVLGSTVNLALADDLNGLEAAGLVLPPVLLAGAVVLDVDAVDDHGERSLGVVGLAAGPCNHARFVRRVTTGPDTDADRARSLRVVLTTIGIAAVESADGLAVDDPGQSITGPVEGVGVKGLGVGDITLKHAVVGSGVALSEVVHLDLVVDAAEELPVDLVKILRLKNDGRDDALAGGRLGLDLDVTEVKICLGLDGWGLTLLVDGELGALTVVGERSGSLLPALDFALAVLEVGLELGGHGWVVRAFLLHGVAVGMSLGTRKRCESASSQV